MLTSVFAALNYHPIFVTEIHEKSKEKHIMASVFCFFFLSLVTLNTIQC